MVIRMNQESTLRMEIEHLRRELNEAALRDLNSEECFRVSLKLDAVLEKFYNREEPRYKLKKHYLDGFTRMTTERKDGTGHPFFCIFMKNFTCQIRKRRVY